MFQFCESFSPLFLYNVARCCCVLLPLLSLLSLQPFRPIWISDCERERRRGVEGEHRWRWEIVCCRYFSPRIWLCDRKQRNIATAWMPIFPYLFKSSKQVSFRDPFSLQSIFHLSPYWIFPIKILHRKSWNFVALSSFSLSLILGTFIHGSPKSRWGKIYNTTLLFPKRKKCQI